MRIGIAVSSVVAAVACAGTVEATPLTLVNAGFESPALADGAQVNSAPGWNDLLATFRNPTTALFPGQAYEGQNIAYFTQPGSLTQLVAPLAYGTYTLTAAVGDPLGSVRASLSLSLRAGTSFLSPTLTSFTSPGDGAWSIYSVSYDVTPTNVNGTLFFGDTFNIFALATGSGAVGVDDVTLDFVPMDESPVPEPASVGLVGAGLLSLALRRRWSVRPGPRRLDG